ncbi:hypothetical protein [Bradyrhizobium sp. CCGUVB14]|uniref:hypothetical protein n=1 Tax=Bradyrhizobium sp. CCGUVB14 TaxID=2949628 RepID=UPI0020B1C548|nr:hypothetical protein [Bradyrhizobium sp. CCGUVB14]MCP3447423.1 hypothetical protein [Bradyrhizobium sp. CCGUVB14]
MSKMTRMNNDPGQVALATLLVRAGSGEDEPLLRAIRDEQWTPLQMSDRIAHALTLAQQMFLASEYLAAKTYASSIHVRYEAFEKAQTILRKVEPEVPTREAPSMAFDYLADFPIPASQLPNRLRALLEPVGSAPHQAVEVTSRYDFDLRGPKREYVQMIMAAVPDDGPIVTPLLRESANGVVASSTPAVDDKGGARAFSPSISGHDYIVASWGNRSFYTYNLAEKVWMALGLSPRCVGNDSQRMIYDDLSLPEFGVAEGEISNEFYWTASRNISWKMSNEYLRKYLWMRGAHGVRVFFYEALLPDEPQLRATMNGEAHVRIHPNNGWYDLDIRELEGGLLIQVWATVKAIPPELCPEQSANGINWPDISDPMTHDRANALVGMTPVFLNDRFLERYEQSSFYETMPVNSHGRWLCSPSYRGQWSFTDCERVGRNLIQVPIRELYKAKPDREILHAHSFAVSVAEVAHFDPREEHIASKVGRLVDQLLDLGDNLSSLADALGIQKTASGIVGFSRAEINANGWSAYPQLSRLAQVAPLDMSQQAFLSRCKSLHEVWQKIPDGFLKFLLESAGCRREDVKQLGSLKLLQALLNIVTRLNANEELADAFKNSVEPEGWGDKNAAMAPLFLNNDLRIADAHEVEQCLRTLQKLGFDTANVNQGYGRALDFVMDGVIDALAALNKAIAALFAR